jgi:hypothetical protein
MMQKRLLSLLLITLAVLGIGLILSQRQQPVAQGQQSNTGPLVPGLTSALNEVSSIRISKAGDELIAELKRSASGWTVANRHDYPADIGKVREYLIKLSEARVREAKTSKPENYARLGVADLGSEGATGLGVEVGGLTTPVKLIVGVGAGGGSPGTFVRRADEAESYLVSGDVIPDKEGGNWLAREILSLPSAEVRAVAVTAPDKSVLKIDKTDPGAFNYTVHGIPKGRELSSESVGNLTAAVLDGLTLEDVRPSAEATPDAASTWTAAYAGYDGHVVEVMLWESDGKSWARFAARVDEAALDQWVAGEKAKADAARATAQAEAAAKAAATEAKPADATADAAKPTDAMAEPVIAAADDAAAPIPEPFDADKVRADKLAELHKRVDELNARTSPWAYAIPSWKAGNIKKKIDDMLQPKS